MPWAPWVTAVTFHPLGRRLVSVCGKEFGEEQSKMKAEIKVWDLDSGQEALATHLALVGTAMLLGQGHQLRGGHPGALAG